jgi:hypothetical protein
MKTFILRLPAAEVVHLLRTETTAAYGAPELHTAAEKEYVIEEDFDRSAYGIHDGEEFDLVISIATLTIEPRVESGYWILETFVERALGLLRTSQEDELTRRELTLDEFEAELRSPGRKRVSVRLYVETSDVKQDFDQWLREMRARHPWKAEADFAQGSMTEDMTDTANRTYRAREVVGVFSDANALEAAIDELEVSGFDRAAISVLATSAKAKDHVDRFYRTVSEVEDSGRVSRKTFVSRDSRAEVKRRRSAFRSTSAVSLAPRLSRRREALWLWQLLQRLPARLPVPALVRSWRPLSRTITRRESRSS